MSNVTFGHQSESFLSSVIESYSLVYHLGSRVLTVIKRLWSMNLLLICVQVTFFTEFLLSSSCSFFLTHLKNVLIIFLYRKMSTCFVVQEWKMIYWICPFILMEFLCLHFVFPFTWIKRCVGVIISRRRARSLNFDVAFLSPLVRVHIRLTIEFDWDRRWKGNKEKSKRGGGGGWRRALDGDKNGLIRCVTKKRKKRRDEPWDGKKEL